MIIYNQQTLRELISTLHEYLNARGINVENARLYEIFSHSQGFKTYAALVSSLPIMLDESAGVTRELIESFRRYGIKSEDHTMPSTRLLADMADRKQAFPTVAGPRCGLRLNIDWDDGRIYLPSEYHESDHRSCPWNELYGHSSSFVLPGIVLKKEYEALREEIAPIVDRVVAGYSNNGTQVKASFTDDANEALEELSYLIDDFEFEYSDQWGPLPMDLYYDEAVHVSDVEELKLTEIRLDGELLLDYSFTDIQLRQLVAEEENRDIPIKHESLYLYFKDLRDDCLKNFEEQSQSN
ncbi:MULTISPECIES: hypothetical protein [unclassified Oleiphilus]|uniref:hypothetical protein n=2 Tax=Oleiphilus TaxID=141450 RepID=UPI0007C40786|nr:MULTISPECIES: hypothetical protein [unclassified Oleiphilus]KZZ37313.1 hypothetical protein A3757_11760 [Oleiphilus sp. HI0117]KZZ54209.1 hypothetical protein A3761_14880 [Oleiphilus sp. HI0123]